MDFVLCLFNNYSTESGSHGYDNPHSLTPLLITAYRGTSASGFALQVACVRLSPILQSCFCTVDQVRLTSVMALHVNFILSTHCNFKIIEVNSKDYNIK